MNDRTFAMLIHGQRVTTGKTFPVVNPETEQVLAQVPEVDPTSVDQALGRVRKALRLLGCIVPPGMQHTRPMGASVHYAGMIPMAAEGQFTTDARCRTRAWDNVWIADGATFPFLPSKNITFTLMANAARIAATAF